MNDAVKKKPALAPSSGTVAAPWPRIPFQPNTSRLGTLKKQHILLLAAVSIVLHAAGWWLVQQAKEPVPEVAPQVPEMTVELTSPTPPSPEPPPPEPPPPPPPPPPPEPEEDPDAVKPPPKPVVKKVEKPKPVQKPQPVKMPTPPTPPAPAPAPAQSAPPSPTPAPAAPAAAPGPVKESAAISGLASLGNPPPEYPSLALRRSWEGTVVLRIKVLPNGRAGSVEVTKSSGKEQLDQAAVEAVRNWKFIPAKRGDTPIEGFATQTIDFKLPQ
ncbi:ferric siderophore ABC transporter substrate-binding protein [Pseudomonas sp. M47T1]|uniref:energy transducer TonB n=1 Tax=Pseudomonas sp. M47T1 TaxID=1179778 RepID=UPI0002608017|nr:energy transducer TonB [Pseudomonas sp. M47T1]EIK95970.1 ferric siderophore ABC transporter substrate-binding protein [Pseudomonas sp. M47T1]